MQNARVLLCGVDIDIFSPEASPGETCDATFVGFIGRFEDTRRKLDEGGVQIDFGIYAALYEDWVLRHRVSAQDFAALLALRDRFLAEHGVEHGALSRELRHIVDEIIPRSVDRAIIVRQLIEATRDVQIFGPDHWASWPDFAPCYQGPATLPVDLARIYSMGRVTLHNGGYLAHPRVLEAMAAGAVVLANADAYADRSETTGANFIPDENLLLYSPGGLKAVAEAALVDHDLRRRIRMNAAALIRAGHTWDHRVSQILHDLQALGRDFPATSSARDDAGLHSGHVHP